MSKRLVVGTATFVLTGLVLVGCSSSKITTTSEGYSESFNLSNLNDSINTTSEGYLTLKVIDVREKTYSGGSPCLIEKDAIVIVGEDLNKKRYVLDITDDNKEYFNNARYVVVGDTIEVSTTGNIKIIEE